MSAFIVAITVATAAFAGCTGIIGDDSESGGANNPPPGPNGPITSGLKDALVDSTRFPRLTHLQWENTVRDLLKLSAVTGKSSSFTTDPPGSTFGNDGNLLKVTPGLWGDYAKAAEEIAEKLATDSAQIAKLAPADLPTEIDAKAKAWIAVFGKRAYRRPLSEAEVNELLPLFKRGAELTGVTDPFAAGVAITVQFILQSPNFVYRLELGKKNADGSYGLTPYEMASRLSYSLWNTMPDDSLFAAAEDGSLGTPEGVTIQAKRMLDDSRAEPTVADFHAKLLDFNHFDALTKDTTKFPEWKPEMSVHMRKEAELFVRDVTLTQSKGLTELLTADYTFVNADTAPLYGLTGTYGTEFTKAKLDPTQRAGFLTQIGFLASNASPREHDPIHRGVFINLKIICANLPPPPMNVPPLPKDETGTFA